jgi:hypothetical protein
MADRLMVRSYRRVFEVDRRIYRVDRWALPVPGGVPLRGVVYFVLALCAVLVLGSLPGVGEVLGGVSAPLRLVVIPLAVAALGTQAAPDGRSAHRYAGDWLRLRLRAKRTVAGRAVPAEGEPVAWGGGVASAWDEHRSVVRRGLVHGPASVQFSGQIALAHGRGGRLIARPRRPGEITSAETVVVGADQVLEVRP